MATRNLTRRFNAFRAENGSAKEIHSLSVGGSGAALQDSNISTTIEIKASLPPVYVDFVDLIEQDSEAILDGVRKLRHLHSRRLKVSFTGNEHEQEKEISDLSQQIQTMLSRSEQNLKKIATVGNNGRISTAERVCRLNMMRSYAKRLQHVSKEFKTAQRNFVMALKGQSEFGRDFFGEQDADKIQHLDDMTEQEEQKMLLEQIGKERDEEIEELVESIGTISSLFKELSVLVIDQGTVLDRIDYNVECVLDKAKDGTKQMKKAYKYSKNNRSIVCIFFLSGLMIFLLMLVALKYSM
mmetsp:Transcript_12245/g.17043  ORF Transcript_12245/g.17043 Transcript_12245/m.17043 type:complete len:297 (-) Transcript_12245:119-1009(-)